MDENQYSYQFYNSTQAAWDAMYEAILCAQTSILWEVYIFLDDEIGVKFIKALVNKAKAGVQVKLIFDAFGSLRFSTAAEKYFKNTGVELLWYNPLFPSIKIFSWLSRLMRRNHRKILIVDEADAFLGGVNINYAYRSWPDLFVRIKGRVVHPLLRGFGKSYISCGGDKTNVKKYLHPKLAGWKEYKEKIQFLLHSHKFQKESAVRKWYIKALATANQTVNLVSPYFVPDKKFIKAIARARARGVKINLYLPLRPDHKFMELLARWYYELAEKAGANIFFSNQMNHSKGLSIDGKMGMIGSANLNRRSFWLDSEAGVMFTDGNMVRELNEFFSQLHNNSTPLSQIKLVKLSLAQMFEQWVLKRIEKYF